MTSSAYVAFVLIVCCRMMTSFAMTSLTFSKIVSSSGARVCSDDSTSSPYHVIPLLPGGEIRCGIKCSVSSLCWYYQLKSSSTPGKCELYNTLPVNFTAVQDCVGFAKRFPGKYQLRRLRFLKAAIFFSGEN